MLNFQVAKLVKPLTVSHTVCYKSRLFFRRLREYSSTRDDSSFAVSESKLHSGYGSFNGYGGGGGYHRYRHRSLPANTIIKFVPQQQAWIVERFGKFHRILEPGLAILMPFIDQIKYVKTLKEVAVEIPQQSAITQDNVTITIDGVLYYRVDNPYKACYGIEDADFSISQLAQTTMRSEIGQMSLDKTLAERTLLNHNITHAINEAAEDWGIKCLRYEIRDIHPPESVVKAMHSQVSAERQKRALILESEGQRQSQINVAEGGKQSQILASEAVKLEQINMAAGEAEAILLKANATAMGIRKVADVLVESRQSGDQAVSLIVAEKYIEAFAELAKKSTTLLLPSGAHADPASFVTQAMSIFNTINKRFTEELPNSGEGKKPLQIIPGDFNNKS